ncbi:MAG: cytochrome c3 family protein [Gammaproteobacteria bacterium]|nr:cytochrome c3 family protein [Gammaproteobacteria bacterium]
MAISLSTLLYLISAGILRAQVTTDELHGDCLSCHVTDSQTDGSLILAEPEVCQLCHSPHNDHTVLIQPIRVDPSLPLTNGLMTCVTCHDPHSPQPLQLRLPATQLCAACHDL